MELDELVERLEAINRSACLSESARDFRELHRDVQRASLLPSTAVSSAERARLMRERYATGDYTTAMLARQFGLTPWGVVNILTGHTWPEAGGPICEKTDRAVRWPPNVIRAVRERRLAGEKEVDVVRDMDMPQSTVNQIALGRVRRNLPTFTNVNGDGE